MAASNTDDQTRVVVVGGGFTGTMIAVHLMNHAKTPLVINHIEARPVVGLGLAYSTECDGHLLNVRAQGMSAFPDEATHFVDFAARSNLPYGPESFAPRKFYGEYIRAILQQSLQDTASRSIQYNALRDEAVSVVSASGDEETSGCGYVVTLASGATIRADQVVLATGNLPGKLWARVPHSLLERRVYVHDPWCRQSIDEIGTDETVMLIGTGLTAVDKVIELLAQGHRGKMVAVSRHGWLPRPHAEHGAEPLAPPLPADIPTSVLATIKFMRDLILRCGDWRQAVDSLRGVTQPWWWSLSAKERSRVDRHLQSLWDVHRHRMAPEIGASIKLAIDSGQMEVIPGRVQSIADERGAAQVVVARRARRETVSLLVDRVINCTGFGSKLANRDSRLFANLIASRTVLPVDSGIAADAKGRVLTDRGQICSGLYVAGSILKPQLFETVAVPELRQQAADIATLVLESIANSATKLP